MSESRREADRRWAREQIEQYRAVLPRYQTYARTLHRVLEAAVRQHAPGAIVQVRVKSVPSFAEKIQRKRHKYGDPVRQLTDLCGGRVIVHTRAEVEAVSTLIETHYEVDWEC